MKTVGQLRGLAAGLLLSATFSHAADAEERITQVHDGITYNFAPEDESIAREFMALLVAAQRAPEPVATDTAGAPTRLTVADLRLNRADFLQRIAAAIGLEKPTELQLECYDGFLENFERTDKAFTYMVERLRESFVIRGFSIYQKSDLIRRLKAGEKIPGAVLDPDGENGRVEFASNFSGRDDPYLQELDKQRNQRRLDLGYDLSTRNGVVSLSGFIRGKKAVPVPPSEQVAPGPTDQPQLLSLSSLPLVVGADMAPLPPGEIAAELMKFVNAVDKWRRQLNASMFQPPAQLAWLIFHETAEIGIVEHYLGSADRRWFCEGVANHVAWQVARDVAGEDAARQVYDLGAQLAAHAEFRPEINLGRWPAAENQPKEQQDTPLNRAHYTFATNAVRLMVERHGADFLPHLFREIGRTPREKAKLRTVENAYRNLTRQRLPDLLAAATAAPKASAPSR